MNLKKMGLTAFLGAEVALYALILTANGALLKWSSFLSIVLSVAFLLFLLCDTVIGLQVAAGGYLPIGTDTALYRFLFMPFNLAWFFYLPSQVLIAIFGENVPLTKAG